MGSWPCRLYTDTTYFYVKNHYDFPVLGHDRLTALENKHKVTIEIEDATRAPGEEVAGEIVKKGKRRSHSIQYNKM